LRLSAPTKTVRSTHAVVDFRACPWIDQLFIGSNSTLQNPVNYHTADK